MIRKIGGTVLTQAGYRVQTACDGVEAASLFASRHDEFALLITDLDMPRLNGAALARAARTLNPAVKILAMSGIASQTVHGTTLDCADAFLGKPFTGAQILEHVQRLLSPKTGESAAARPEQPAGG